MTTIAYDGKILAADTRSTYGTDDAEQCPNCEHDLTHYYKHGSDKIDLLQKNDGIVFRDDKIKAVGFSGYLTAIKDALTLLKKGRNLEQTVSDMRVIKAHDPLATKAFTLLMIGEKKLYLISSDGPTTPTLTVKEKELSEKVCIGSGEPAANAAFLLFNCNAIEAVQLATHADAYSGGAVMSVDLSLEEKPNELTKTDAIDLETLKSRLYAKPIGQVRRAVSEKTASGRTRVKAALLAQ